MNIEIPDSDLTGFNDQARERLRTATSERIQGDHGFS
jgi:hypothetical protein